MKSMMWLLLAGALGAGAALPAQAAPLNPDGMKAADEGSSVALVHSYRRHYGYWHYPRKRRYYRYYYRPYYTYGYYRPYYRHYYYRPYRRYYSGPSFGIWFGHRGRHWW